MVYDKAYPNHLGRLIGWSMNVYTNSDIPQDPPPVNIPSPSPMPSPIPSDIPENVPENPISRTVIPKPSPRPTALPGLQHNSGMPALADGITRFVGIALIVAVISGFIYFLLSRGYIPGAQYIMNRRRYNAMPPTNDIALDNSVLFDRDSDDD